MSSHDPSGAQHLVQMANDIGNFFRAEPSSEDAVAGIANHIQKFWTPRMQRKILPELQNPRSSLDPLPRSALERVCSCMAASPTP